MDASFYDHLPVPDGLAGVRTFLAAERTLLAYARTAFAMFAAGVTAAELLQNRVLVVIGYLMAILGLLVFLVGALRYRRSRTATRRMLERLQEQSKN